MDEALADFERILELAPNDVVAISRRGDTYRLMNRYDAALADLTAHWNSTQMMSDFRVRGKTLSTDGPIHEAITRLTMHWNSPNDSGILLSKSRLTGLWGSTTQRWRFLGPSESTQIVHGSYWPWEGLSFEQYDVALADFNRAVDLYPKNAWVIAQRGETYRLLGRFASEVVPRGRAAEHRHVGAPGFEHPPRRPHRAFQSAFPWQAVTPSTSNSGLRSASRMDSASSMSRPK